jgi:hypothetical protein
MKAALMAGMDEVHVLVDHRDLSRSQVRAKQIAHNAISGEDDVPTLRLMVAQIVDAESRLEAFITDEALELNEESASVHIPDVTIPFEQHLVQLVFLPNQLHDWNMLVERLAPHAVEIGVVDVDVFESFLAACQRAMKVCNIRQVGSVVTTLMALAEPELARLEAEQAEAEADDSE